MSVELRCAGCGGLMKPMPRWVEVVEHHHVVTSYVDGQPASGRDVPTYAGVFCSRECAVDELTKETR